MESLCPGWVYRQSLRGQLVESAASHLSRNARKCRCHGLLKDPAHLGSTASTRRIV